MRRVEFLILFHARRVCSTSYSFMPYVPCIGLTMLWHKCNTASSFLVNFRAIDSAQEQICMSVLCSAKGSRRHFTIFLFRFHYQRSDMNILVSHCNCHATHLLVFSLYKSECNNDIFLFFWKRFISFSKLCKISCQGSQVCTAFNLCFSAPNVSWATWKQLSDTCPNCLK